MAGSALVALAVVLAALVAEKPARDAESRELSTRAQCQLMTGASRNYGAISAYTEPGQLVVDPMCGTGTSLVEAIHLNRTALGIELERRWASLAQQTSPTPASKTHAATAACSRATPASSPASSPTPAAASAGQWRGSGPGSVDLVLTSPPYGRDLQLIAKQGWIAGGSLGAKDARNYSDDRENLGHARGEGYRAAMAEVYAACTAALKPGGFLVVVTKNFRAGDALYDLAGITVELCLATGLLYWQHVIALHVAIRDSELVPRPSFWQLSTTRKALARAERVHLVCHEDVLVFRKPDVAAPASAHPEQAAMRTAA